MALGRVELHGRAQEKAELRAPFTGRACVYYRYTLEELVRSGNRNRWRQIESGDSAAWPFYLEDDTGRVLVDRRVCSEAQHRYEQALLSKYRFAFYIPAPVKREGRPLEPWNGSYL